MARQASFWLRHVAVAFFAAVAVQAAPAKADPLDDYRAMHQDVADLEMRTRIARAHLAADRAFPASKPKISVLVNACKRALKGPTVLIDVVDMQGPSGMWGPGTGTRTITELILRELSDGGQLDKVTIPEGARGFDEFTEAVLAAERKAISRQFRAMIVETANAAMPMNALTVRERASRAAFLNSGLGNFDDKSPQEAPRPKLTVVQLAEKPRSSASPGPRATIPDRRQALSAYVDHFIPEQARPGAIGRVLGLIFGDDSRIARWWTEGRGEYTAFKRIDTEAITRFDVARCGR
jgi:hypothetical protein